MLLVNPVIGVQIVTPTSKSYSRRGKKRIHISQCGFPMLSHHVLLSSDRPPSKHFPPECGEKNAFLCRRKRVFFLHICGLAKKQGSQHETTLWWMRHLLIESATKLQSESTLPQLHQHSTQVLIESATKLQLFLNRSVDVLIHVAT